MTALGGGRGAGAARAGSGFELEAAPDAWKDPGGLPMALDAHVADGAGGGTRRLTLARCSYHPDRLAPDAVA